MGGKERLPVKKSGKIKVGRMLIIGAVFIAAVFTACNITGDTSSLLPPEITITNHPAPTTIVRAGNISGSLSVEAAASGVSQRLSFQWLYTTANSNDGGNEITGATEQDFLIPANLTLGTHHFFVEVSVAGAASVRSNLAAVTVTDVPASPGTPGDPNAPVITIISQPAPVTSVTVGSISGSLAVQVSVTGGAQPGFRWFSNTTNSNVGGSEIAGATNASFTIPANLSLGVHYFFVEVSTPGAASVRSNAVLVTVTVPPPPPTEGLDIRGDVLYGIGTVTVTDIVIPSTVTSVRNYAFHNGNLTSVTIPASVTTIEGWAFGANNLTTITIPAGVTITGINSVGLHSVYFLAYYNNPAGNNRQGGTFVFAGGSWSRQ